MYLLGAHHPHKTDAQILIERFVAAGERLATDAEVFQEILHRYTAIGRKEAIVPAFQLLAGIADQVFGIDKADVFRAGEIVQSPAGLSARDAVHVAIMERHGVQSILTFDSNFDRWPGIKRIWRV